MGKPMALNLVESGYTLLVSKKHKACGELDHSSIALLLEQLANAGE